MTILHVHIETDDGWLIGQALEEPGVITQARSLDELVANVRDAASLLLNVKHVHVELIVPPAIEMHVGKRPRSLSRKAG